MLTVRSVHPFELLCNPTSPNVWFLWRSLVRDDAHFCFQLPPFDRPPRIPTSFRCIFALQFWFHHPVDVLAVEVSSFSSWLSANGGGWMLSTFELTDIDGPTDFHG